MKISKLGYPENWLLRKIYNLLVRYFMDELADYRRTNNKKKYVQDYPEGILDVIETDYPGKYFLMLEDRTLITKLFSNEEWLDILIKSRNSYRSHIHRMNLTRKYSSTQGVQLVIG